MNEITSVTTNGSCVTTIMKTSAGNNGARRAQSEARRRPAEGGPGGVAVPVPPPVLSTASVMGVSPFRKPQSALPGAVAFGDVLGQFLTAVQGLVDAHLAGDRGADVLRHLGAEVGELGDVD